MKLINTLTLKFKLYILLALIIFSFLLISAIGYFNMYKMKTNLDNLYFGSFIPVGELSQLQSVYNKDITLAFYQLKSSQISPAVAAAKIDLSRQKITHIWKAYQSHFKRDYELSYLEYAHGQLMYSTAYLKRLSKAISSLDEKNIPKLSSVSLLTRINSINEVIDTILKYEQDIAKYERKMLIITYEETLYKLLAIIIFVIASTIIIVIPIFNSIQNNERSIIHASRKLEFANKKLETASITDALTELFNRRYFNLVYTRELTRCIREKKPLCFMMLDIDFFKGYNDTYGHLKGDAALKKVADTMKKTLKRPGDYLFRLGGEEFGILISNITEDKAYHMAEKLRQNIQSLEIEHKENKASDYLTTSIGLISLFPDQSSEADYIIQQADENLYKAKDSGRNRVISSTIDKELTPLNNISA
ncbi:diguanylate cyclase [Sulfurimonas sp. MAG313]|nr:diguanylate cyclase [Sulfurimonas sp. MAG313]MDF1880230.1 diguanylate cyclase [Sulfurimonas sp. MAG313]